MTLASGTRFGPYEVADLIGAGGMGEVYRAIDTNLGRHVAIKILPPLFGQDAERLARFEREASTLASLNHPRIAQIYSLERTGGGTALVMELVEGQTLADRIARGPIPLEESLSHAAQIAEGLEAAHDRGIIHRDLKPANVKLSDRGEIKILDFGLAKALDPAALSDQSTLPTITSPAMTRAGVILGTASYMSPEQARGLTVDRGADIWAWGCVLFEMLTGDCAFGGTDITEVLAMVVRGDPDWSRLPAATPASVRSTLRRCLEKDRKRRLADIRDARFAIEDAAHASPAARIASPGPFRRERLIWATAVLLCVGTAAAALLLRDRGSSADALPQLHAEITTPPTTDLVSNAISPDGRHLVYVASSSGRPVLWLRSLVTGEARPLPGTDGASFPFWSPDSRTIGFFASQRLYRIDADGGSLREIAPAPVGTGGTWGADDVILFTPVPDATIRRVAAAGGRSEPVTGDQMGSGGQRFPQWLPDGRHYLYYVAETVVRGVYIGRVDGPQRKRLLDADAAAVFVPPDELLFSRTGTLFTQRFDLASQRPAGDALPIATGVAVDSVGSAAISASATGTILFRRGSAGRERQLRVYERGGTEVAEPYAPDAASAVNPALSPNQRFLAFNRAVAGNADIWIMDLSRRGAFMRLTTVPTPDIYPVWSPQGDRIMYGAIGKNGFDLWQIPTSGAGQPSLVFAGPAAEVPMDWSADGRFVLFRSQLDPVTGIDLWALPMTGDPKPFPIANSAADEGTGAFSPDGTWIAFESDETGRQEIFIQPFPGPGTRTLASTGGGVQPRWSPGGKELFYIGRDGRLMVVPLRFGSDGKTVEPSSPVGLFVTRVSSTIVGGSRQEYVISADGRRFFMNTLVEQSAAPITLIVRRKP